MYVIMDMGTTNTRLYMCANGSVIDHVKAILAPLPDAKLFAVGGVNADNAGKFFEMGFCGIGVGSNLYDKKLIKEKKFDALRVLASKYSRLSKSTD